MAQQRTQTARRFCIVRRSTGVLRPRDTEELIDAQKELDDELLTALETMVKAARAGNLEGRAALAQACVAW
jgi:hypothetical protein